MENLEKKLEKIGLNDKESQIYQSLLKEGKMTIVKISKATNIKRTTIYHCLDNLIDKGLVNKIEKNNHKYYYAEDPQISLKTLVKEREEAVKELIPDLKGILGTGLYQPEITIYRNTNGIKRVLEDILSTKESINRYYLSENNLEDLVGVAFVDNFVKKRIALRIKSLALRSSKYRPKREKEITHAKQFREVRFMPKEMSIKPYICIYGDKVAVISSKDEKMGFIIRSHEFAEAQKAIFDMIWNSVAI